MLITNKVNFGGGRFLLIEVCMVSTSNNMTPLIRLFGGGQTSASVSAIYEGEHPLSIVSKKSKKKSTFWNQICIWNYLISATAPNTDLCLYMILFYINILLSFIGYFCL